MSVKQGYLYILDNDFYTKVNDPKLSKAFKGDIRPVYIVKKDKNTGLYWVAPCSKQWDKYQNLISLRQSDNKSTSGIQLLKTFGVKSVFLLQDMFPVSENYINTPYIIRNQHVNVTNPNKISDFERISNDIEKDFRSYKNPVNYRPDAINIEKFLLAEQSDITLHATYTTESAKHPHHTLILQQGNEYVIIGDQASKNAELLNIPTSTITTGIKATDIKRILRIPQTDFADVLKILSANQAVAVSRPSDGTTALYPKTKTKGDVNMENNDYPPIPPMNDSFLENMAKDEIQRQAEIEENTVQTTPTNSPPTQDTQTEPNQSTKSQNGFIAKQLEEKGFSKEMLKNLFPNRELRPQTKDPTKKYYWYSAESVKNAMQSEEFKAHIAHLPSGQAKNQTQENTNSVSTQSAIEPTATTTENAPLPPPQLSEQSSLETDTIKTLLETLSTQNIEISALDQRTTEETKRFAAMFEELSNTLNNKVEATHLTTKAFEQKFQAMLESTIEDRLKTFQSMLEQQNETITKLQAELSKFKEQEDLTPREQEELDNLQSDISEMQADQKERKGLLSALMDGLKALANKLKEVGISAIDKTAEFLHVRDLGNKIVDNEQKVIDRANGKIDKITAASNKYHEGLHDIKEGIKGSFGKEMQDYTPKTGVIANMRIALHNKTIALSTAMQNIGEKVLDFCNNLERAAQKARGEVEVANESNQINKELEQQQDKAEQAESTIEEIKPPNQETTAKTSNEPPQTEDTFYADASMETVESMQDEMIENQQNEMEELKRQLAEKDSIIEDLSNKQSYLEKKLERFGKFEKENAELSPPPPPTQSANYNITNLQDKQIEPNYTIKIDKLETLGNNLIRAKLGIINPNKSAQPAEISIDSDKNEISIFIGNKDINDKNKDPFVSKIEDLTPAMKGLVSNIQQTINTELAKQQQQQKDFQFFLQNKGLFQEFVKQQEQTKTTPQNSIQTNVSTSVIPQKADYVVFGNQQNSNRTGNTKPTKGSERG